MIVTSIFCPHCLTEHEADDLETFYGRWSGEECGVECPTCSSRFTVFCEPAGFNATDQFDIRTFSRAHGVNVEPGVAHFVEYYLTRAAMGKGMKRVILTETHVQSRDDIDRLQPRWDTAFEVSKKVWEKISGSKRRPDTGS